jgi:hypothetical protein
MTLTIRPVDEAVARAWDDLLMKSPNWSVFQTENWLQFLQETQNVQPLKLGIYAGDRLEGLWAAAEFRKGPFRLVGSPMRGWTTPRMGPAVIPDGEDGEGADPLFLLAAWRKFLVQHKVDHAETSHPSFTDEAAREEGLEIVRGTTFVCPIPPTEEGILAQFHQSCREAARRSLRRGVTVENTDNPAFVDHFYYQLEDVFGKQGLKPTYPKSRVEALWRLLKPTGHLLTLWALHEGCVIGTAFYLLGNRTLHAYSSASLRVAQKHYPNEPIRLVAMKLAAEKGCVAHDLAGGGEYKRKFGAAPVSRDQLLYHRNFVTRMARGLYAGLFRLRQKRAGVGSPMAPRPPLPASHRFEGGV